MSEKSRTLIIGVTILLVAYSVLWVVHDVWNRVEKRNLAIALQAAAIGQEDRKERAYRDVTTARVALRANPDDAWAHIRLSGHFMDQKYYPAAIEHLRAALRAEPDNGKAAWRLGLLLQKTGQKEEAVRVLQQLAQSKSAAGWDRTAQETLDKWKGKGEI